MTFTDVHLFWIVVVWLLFPFAVLYDKAVWHPIAKRFGKHKGKLVVIKGKDVLSYYAFICFVELMMFTLGIVVGSLI